MILMTFHYFSLIPMNFKRKLEEKHAEEKRLKEEHEAQQWVKAEASEAKAEESVRRGCTIC